MGASLLSIPPEICSIICGHVDTSLAPLCRISHSFRDQAQRIMYRTVDLRACSIRLLKSWSLAITRNPHLANRVWALLIQLPNPLEPKEAGILSGAFALCINLKRLAVHHIPGSAPESNSQSWIFKGPFQLEYLFNMYLDTLYTILLDQQAHIRVLSLPDSVGSNAKFYQEFEFPNLIAIDAPLDVVQHLLARPLRVERIQIHQVRRPYDLSSSARFSSTLKALTLVQEGRTTGSPPFAVVDEVLKVLPRLQHLGLREIDRWNEVQEHALIHRLQQFTSLATLTLHLRPWVRPSSPMGFRDPHHRARLRAFGTRILETCAAMREATIAVGMLGREEPDIVCRFTKENDGCLFHIRGGTGRGLVLYNPLK